jgi:hypothetical protein
MSIQPLQRTGGHDVGFETWCHAWPPAAELCVSCLCQEVSFMYRHFFSVALIGATAFPLCSCSRALAPGDWVLEERKVSDVPNGQLVSYDAKSQADMLHLLYVFPEGAGFK